MKTGRKRINIKGTITVLAIIGVFLYLFLKQGPTTISSQDRIQEIELPDGSASTLHRESKLTYKDDYGDRSRQVMLEGEGYFAVKHDPAKPFVVINDMVNCLSSGGAFYINDEQTEQIVEVIAHKGKLAIVPAWGNEKNRIILNQGERAGISKNEQRVKTSLNKDPNALAWTTKEFTFEQEPLDEVVAVLHHAYGKKIAIQSAAIKNCPVTATFQKESLATIIKTLTEGNAMEASFTDNKIILSGEGC